jgi:hypothetical protein
VSASYVVVQFDKSDGTVTENDVFHADRTAAEQERDELQASADLHTWPWVYAVREVTR